MPEKQEFTGPGSAAAVVRCYEKGALDASGRAPVFVEPVEEATKKRTR